MDYEKLYKDALEKAKSCLKDGTITNTAKNYIEDIFPELRESEDERIRKRLIDFFEDWRENRSHCWGITVTNILAWLEKQGEQKPYGQREECSDCQVNYAGECKGSCELKRNKQKLVDKVKPKFKVGDIIIKSQNSDINKFGKFKITGIKDGRYWYNEFIICEISEQDEWELVEPKDYNTFDISFNAKDSELQEASYHIPKGYHAEIDGDKVVIKKGEQKPQRIISAEAKEAMYGKPVWSEKDEEILNVVIKSCEQCGNEYAYYWLKSLKERIGG